MKGLGVLINKILVQNCGITQIFDAGIRTDGEEVVFIQIS